MKTWILVAALSSMLLGPGSGANADEHKLSIFFAGSKVGESTFTKNPDGSFHSSRHLMIGDVSIDQTVDGHMKAGKLVDYTSTVSQPGASTRVRLAGGMLHVDNNGKITNAPLKDTGVCLSGGEFTVSSLLAAAAAIGKNPALTQISISAYSVFQGKNITLRIQLLAPKTVRVGGENHVARRFHVHTDRGEIEYAIDETDHLVGESIASGVRLRAEGWTMLFEDSLAKFPELSQTTFETVTDHGVKMKTRDGVTLVCDIVRPKDDLKHPAILARTPYGRSHELLTDGADFYASRGYLFIAQDCRGRDDSDGNWDPFVNEGPDGYDTIQWIASQPSCDGNVGMIGGSYGGYVQWAAAVLHPPALKCIVPEVSTSDAMHDLPYDDGVFELYLNLWWAHVVAGKKADFSGLSTSLPHLDALSTLPLGKVYQAIYGKKLDFFQKWLDRTTKGDWQGWDYTDHLADSTVPALNISGTWDGDEGGTQMNWSRLRELHRTNQWIIFGPWPHEFNSTHKVGGFEYGPSAIIDLDSVFIRWFDTWLKAKDVSLDKRPKVQLFVTGANKWVELPDWPSPSMLTTTQYFTRDGMAGKAGPPQTDNYTYDPSRAVADAAKEKNYVLLKSEPMSKNTAITTPFVVKLNFTSSAQNTDFFVKVLDIGPDGTVRNICQSGKIRASYLGGMDRERALEPGHVYTASIGSKDFAHEFAKGHRMGILIMSSMFPAYARNLGTLDPIKTATRTVVQKNSILIGGDHPSSVTYEVLWEK